MWFVDSVRRRFPARFRGSRVLEVGSLDVSGTVRRLFDRCDYTGLDVAPGPGVDVVCQGQDFAAPSDSYDTVISCEVMEHNPFWVETFRNMIRLTRPGGLVIMTCAAHGRPEHGTARTAPEDSPLTVGLGWTYYRNLMPTDFLRHDLVPRDFAAYRFYRNFDSCDLYFAGFKAGAPPPDDATRALHSIAVSLLLRNIPRSRAWRNFVWFGLLFRRRN